MTETVRQVLVHLDATAAAMHRLHAARRIASERGAAVCALYATMPSFIGLPYSGEMVPSAVAALVEIDNERRAQAHRAFDAACSTPGPIPSWSETGEVPIVNAFVQQAFYADLLVLGQRDPADINATALPADFAESVIIASGKPALVIPYIGWDKPIGDTIAIAWKPTRESARAVSAALPLLQRAGRAHVIAWGDTGAPEVRGGRLDLEGYLKLHGVEVTWHRQGPESSSTGELLMSGAFDLDADLLVMGCYGHSRARELVLGGTSRTVLRSMTLPVLMAH